MARKSLRPQLNQIRAWVRQGRTDAWIAHQVGVPASQLRDFRHRHGLTGEGEEPDSDVDLRDEIEAEIEAELDEVEPEEEEGATDEGEGDVEGEGDGEGEGEAEGDEDRAGGRRRRRRRRGRRGRGRRRPLEATFDQGEQEGYGIWFDPSIKDDPTYTEHWQGRKALRVTIEPERIVLERAETD
ncbi:MAG TPA: hypothetical protein VKA89_01585 [Solirubrobacterales bacterium]|nr:hypothetical protein [Solirubrobacterales bacterium]